MSNTKSHLIIGPRLHENNYGGVVVLFENLVDYAKENDTNIILLDSNFNNKNKIISVFKLLFSFLKNINKVSVVSLHGTIKDFLVLAPLIVSLSLLYKKRIILRKFGGSFHEYYRDTSFRNKKLIDFSIENSDLVFFETKELVEKFKHINEKTKWWPNSRKPQNITTKEVYKKQFVFISQVKKTKGIVEIIKAGEILKSKKTDVTIDIYGPILDEDLISLLNESNVINYRGVISSDKVYEILKDYNFLLLPSYHPGEGYPGIIVEAFSVGLPVISTFWRSIPELIEDNYNGFLIQPKDYKSLSLVMEGIDQSTYSKLRANAKNSFKDYNSNILNQLFFKI